MNLKFIELNKEAKSNSWNHSLSVREICYYVKELKNNSTPGCEGITTEHLKYALDSKLPLHLCVLFSLCVRTGITPDKFNMGIMVPVLKKTTLDPGCAVNYRPITISVTLSN